MPSCLRLTPGDDFALGLEHYHAGDVPGLLVLKCFEHFGLRGNGVSEIAIDAVADGGMGYGLIAFHQFYFFHFSVD